MAVAAAVSTPPSEGLDDGAPGGAPPSEGIRPIGFLGLVAPMSSLGFALNPGLGLVYDEAIVLLPAAGLVFSFQQRRAACDARRLPYDEAAVRDGVRIVRLPDVERAELVRPVTGHRLVVHLAGQGEQRWILQHGSVDEVRRVLAAVLGDRFVDSAA